MSKGIPTWDEMAELSVDELKKKDQEQSTTTAKFVGLALTHYEETNKRKKRLFAICTWGPGISIALTCLFVVVSGFGWWGFALDPKVQISVIAALGVQSFILIGIIVNAVFKDPINKTKGIDDEES